ncbi:hypothetical protein F4604DRAFT_1992201 [Suillus subluteus]|nr:hypothetical protein F4604DRAFT_1992201 [Suillus subluteus]
MLSPPRPRFANEIWSHPCTHHPSFGRLPDTATDSPIPLSPDPFGRYPSYLESEVHSTPTYWDPATGQFTSIPVESRPSLSSVDEGSVTSTTPSSRFSADSASFSMDAAAAKASTPPVGVKTFKKLWRRSKCRLSNLPRQVMDKLRSRDLHHLLHHCMINSGRRRRRRKEDYLLCLARLCHEHSHDHRLRQLLLRGDKRSAPSEPRRDTERPVSNKIIKPRRPSVLDAGIPPPPKLAEQYLPSNYARTGSGIFERRKSVGQRKMGASSNLSTSSQEVALPSRTYSQTAASLQQTYSPLSPPGSVSPARSLQSTPRHSRVDGSLESAEYELVSTSS